MENAELLMRREIATANSCIISLKKELKRKHTLSGLSHSEIKKSIARHEAQIKRVEKSYIIYKRNQEIQNGNKNSLLILN